jgi:outer membrane protein assembly factor BamB
LPDRLPDNVTAKLSYPLGSGYAGPAVVGTQVIVFHRVGDVERVEALETTTGQSQWQADFPADYAGGYNPDSGPRCVPLVHDGRVFAFGASGRLHAVNLADGRHIWSRALAQDYEAPEGYFGAGSTPIVAGDKVLVNVGGRSGAGIVALDLESGETRWTSTDERVSYASPTSAMLHGEPHYLFLTRMNLVSIDAANGETRFAYPFGKSGLTVTATTPLVFDNRIFLSASYNIGAELLDVAADGKMRRLWSGDNVLSSQYTTAVYSDGYLYGTHGREDSSQLAELRCVDAQSGKVLWKQPGVGVAHLIQAGDKLLVVQVQTGELLLVRAQSTGYQELGRVKISDDALRALPALSGGVLYLRTNSDATSRGRLLGFAVGVG